MYIRFVACPFAIPYSLLLLAALVLLAPAVDTEDNMDGGGLSPEAGIIIALLLLFICIVPLLVRTHLRRLNNGDAGAYGDAGTYIVVPDRRIKRATVEEFLREIAHDKPIRFSRRQLARYTSYYYNRLGAGDSGTVYKGKLPNGLEVAVKVLHRGVDWRPEAQFIADVGAIGRAKHPNLVRLLGFCFDYPLRAFVCEYMERGVLGAFLLRFGRDVSFPTLHSLAVGVARGIQHLHEECRPMVVHHDIRPDNVVLDGALTPKVAVTDIGLARLLNRAADHATAWMQPRGVVENCDVYGFGMLVLEMVSQWRRSFDEGSPSESREWFPKLAWTKYEGGNLVDLVTVPSSGLSDDHATATMVVAANGGNDLQQRTETVERMCKVAFWCVQQRPEARPAMGAVVKMLEGEMDVPPPVNPFMHLMAVPVWANDDVKAVEASCGRSGGEDATWMYPNPNSVDFGCCEIAPDLVECCFA